MDKNDHICPRCWREKGIDQVIYCSKCLLEMRFTDEEVTP